MKNWVKSVEKVDDLTVTFTLNSPNPRFLLDYFAVKIWGSINMMPEHIWKDQDPLTFKNYDPAAGLPMGGDLEYADEVTLGRALTGRREV